MDQKKFSQEAFYIHQGGRYTCKHHNSLRLFLQKKDQMGRQDGEEKLIPSTKKLCVEKQLEDPPFIAAKKGSN